MTANSFDWDDELPPETEEEVYGALLRALRRKQGFGLFFVQCSKAQGEKAVADLRRNLPQQRIQELHLQGEVVTLYDQIDALWQQQPFEVLVIEGLQASLYAYEDTKRFSGWSSEEIYNYSWKGVPKILNHLSQQRENLRNDFPARFVFLMPPFVVDYFIQRAADFLDWRSGLFRFPRDSKEILQDAKRFASTGGYTEYLTFSPQKRIEKILELKSLQEICPDSESRTKLLFELGLLFAVEQDYGNAIASYDKALDIKPDNHQAWSSRGNALSDLGHKEEAIASYDKALDIQRDDYQAWNDKGYTFFELGQYAQAISSFKESLQIKQNNDTVLSNLAAAFGRLDQHEETIAYCDKALASNPNNENAWFDRGISLHSLGRYEEAIASYDKALDIKPDDYQAWYNRAFSLHSLGRYEEAIASYDKVLEFEPELYEVWYDKACCYGLQKKNDLAIESLQQAMTLNSKCRELAKTDSDFDAIRDSDRFQALLEE